MLFKKANGQVSDVDVSKASVMILGPSVGAESILSQFTSGEINGMLQWARTHRSANGAINLVNWPGWQDACERLHLDAGRAREVAAALLARLGTSTL
ncbi:hypothetical protein [Massilia sp. LC238]|jgi:hypothetical protein|uniref:hypothetical protein n=1 Tax=Massilia sp. LC238 TaxID=1502852 RepID=UPI0004E40301|nr:hypothetical protein [Massilia sp. LC238]KFC73301.1 hypothetical protein FG94_01580 [Massilia sp. LC238]